MKPWKNILSYVLCIAIGVLLTIAVSAELDKGKSPLTSEQVWDACAEGVKEGFDIAARLAAGEMTSEQAQEVTTDRFISSGRSRQEYMVTKAVCRNAMYGNLHRAKTAGTGEPQKLGSPTMPYRVLYEPSINGGLAVKNGPVGIVTVATVLVDQWGVLYFFDEPTYPLFGRTMKLWRDRRAAAEATKVADPVATESFQRLNLARNNWTELRHDDRVVVIPPPVIHTGNESKVEGVYTFQPIKGK
ncbi:MAG: hypothetical protein AAB817_00395 [Patescibacteria group bacterium]